MSYKPRHSAWMLGNEAIEHIQAAEKHSTEADAINQLLAAIVDRVVGAIPADLKGPPWESSSIAAESDSIPSPEIWRSARIGANGTVQFLGEDYARPFKVIRENVLRIWPTASALSSGQSKHTKARPIDTGIREAIGALWGEHIPHTLKAKDRDEQIAKWLRSKGYSVPSGTGLSRAVQRAMKSRAE